MPLTPDDKLELLFDPKLIPDGVRNALPDHLHIRPLALDDYDRGHLATLSALTKAPDVGREAWQQRFRTLVSFQPSSYYCLAILDVQTDEVRALGTVFIEFKFLRGLGKVGHIEDIVVDPKAQKLGLGRRVIDALTAIAEASGCYKVILDCSEENRPFYEKCGYKLAGVEMAKYAESAQPKHSTQ